MNYIYQKAFYRAAKAVGTLIETNYIDEFPLPIKEIIEQDRDVQLFTFNEFCKMTGYEMRKLINYGGSEEAFHIKKGNMYAIVYNNKIYKKRLRFTLAHEYGHFIMDHHGMGYKKTPILQDSRRTKLEEFEANSFASCLLFPLNVRYRYRNILSTNEVADMFNISYRAAEVALEIFDEHMENGLEDYISTFEHNQMTSYMAFLDEMIQGRIDEYTNILHSEYS